MEVASEDTLLGPFEGETLDHFGERYRFVREAGVHRVEVDGVPHEVAYGFGVDPLQMLLVPGERGRLQALGVAWDARPAADGGQRWFSLHPDEAIPPGDVLHWAGPAGRWNSQCAACHSTQLVRGYDAAADAYDTRFAELDVSCEACHGPGGRHAAWAEAGGEGDPGLTVPLSRTAAWSFVEGEPIARRRGDPPAGEIEVCAPCHSRRSRLLDPPEVGAPFLDGHRPALLSEGLYHADGQIEDEVYVWGSFLQSRMHAAGVVCSDCHDPHALEIGSPDAVCSSCHRAEVFGSPAHHGHAPASAGASCVACHMPASTYMEIDPRRDHRFGVPRPDLSAAIGAPDACTGCHAERDAAWAAEAIGRWRGAPLDPRDHPALVIDAGRRRLPGAGRALAALAEDASRPAILRATALELLAGQLDRETAASVRRALGSDEALVRLGALEAAAALPPSERFGAVAPRLADPVRAVRAAAARVAVGVPPDLRGSHPAFAAALAEHREAQRANADHPEAQVNLGDLERDLGAPDRARAAYARARTLAPWFVPAWVNGADLERAEGDEAEAERLLRTGLEVVPGSADLHHALGLLLVRTGRREAAIEPLALAADLAPAEGRYAYVHGVALLSAGRLDEARDVLEAAARAHPGDRAVAEALVALHRERGDAEAARRAEARLGALREGRP